MTTIAVCCSITCQAFFIIKITTAGVTISLGNTKELHFSACFIYFFKIRKQKKGRCLYYLLYFKYLISDVE